MPQHNFIMKVLRSFAHTSFKPPDQNPSLCYLHAESLESPACNYTFSLMINFCFSKQKIRTRVLGVQIRPGAGKIWPGIRSSLPSDSIWLAAAPMKENSPVHRCPYESWCRSALHTIGVGCCSSSSSGSRCTSSQAQPTIPSRQGALETRN